MWVALGFALVAGWTMIAALGRDANPGPQLGLLAGGLAAYVTGRAASRLPDALPHACAALAGVVAAAVVTSPDGLSGEALAGPLGYGNANGALCAVGAGAALVAGLSRSRTAGRVAGVLAGCGLTGLAILTRSTTAAVVCAALVLAYCLLCWRPSAGRSVPALGAMSVLLVLLATVALGIQQQNESNTPSGVSAALSERRLVLWSESLDLLEREPARGVGPDRFQKESPTAVADEDARWSHSVWLQQAAETGLPGLVLALGLAATLLLRVRAEGWEDLGVPAMGAATMTGVLVHSSLDYVLHFWPVVVASALLLGLTTRFTLPVRTSGPPALHC